jgi:hypothetical protein
MAFCSLIAAYHFVETFEFHVSLHKNSQYRISSVLASYPQALFSSVLRF